MYIIEGQSYNMFAEQVQNPMLKLDLRDYNTEEQSRLCRRTFLAIGHETITP